MKVIINLKILKNYYNCNYETRNNVWGYRNCSTPKDERYKDLIGEEIIIPISKKELLKLLKTSMQTLIRFWCSKNNSTHDFNDYQVGTEIS